MTIAPIIPLIFALIFFTIFYRTYRFNSFVRNSNKILNLKDEELKDNSYTRDLAITHKTKYLIIDYMEKTIRKNVIETITNASRALVELNNTEKTAEHNQHYLISISLENKTTGKIYKRDITDYTIEKYKDKRNSYSSRHGLTYKSKTTIFWKISDNIPPGNYKATIKTYNHYEILNKIVKEKTFNLIIGTTEKEFSLIPTILPFTRKVKEPTSSSQGPITRR